MFSEPEVSYRAGLHRQRYSSRQPHLTSEAQLPNAAFLMVVPNHDLQAVESAQHCCCKRAVDWHSLNPDSVLPKTLMRSLAAPPDIKLSAFAEGFHPGAGKQ